jgi:hydroxymethylbilane synthase
VSPAKELRLGTRGSQLALWQANMVAARIAETGGPPCRIVVIKTSGDQLQEAPLSEVGGKRLFVKEIEDALLRDDIDLAVHSSKDMPAVLPDGLAIAGVLPREDPLDAVVLPVRLKADAPTLRETDATTVSEANTAIRGVRLQPDQGSTIDDLVAALGQSPSIGTGSVRRIAQLTRVFPAARFTPIRGNLDTRLRKLDAGEYDALVLAAAGLRRLGFASRISVRLPAGACVPAPGQGIVAIEVRAGVDGFAGSHAGGDNAAVRQAIARIDDPAARAALDAERALVAALGGGCQTPIGALASPVDEDMLELVAAVISLDGSRALRGQGRGLRRDAAALGARVGAALLADGADQILADVHRTHAAVAGLQP